jgi:hypothetical protein
VAGRVTILAGVLLAMLVTAGTGCYVAGLAPPFPYNAWAFNGLLAACLLLALLRGR